MCGKWQRQRSALQVSLGLLGGENIGGDFGKGLGKRRDTQFFVVGHRLRFEKLI